MSTRLMIDTEAKIVYSTYHGTVKTEDLIRHIEAIRSHPQFDPDFDELIDATGVTVLDIASTEVRELAFHESPFHPAAKRVLVAPQDVVFGLGRMFQTLGSESRPYFIVVRSLDEAHRRLGLERLPKAQ